MSSLLLPDDEISGEIWLFAQEVQTSLKSATELIASDINAKDEFHGYLNVWCVGLGVLAHEYLDTGIQLLEKRKSRVAFILPRFILEMHLRITYYHDDVKEMIARGKSADETEAAKALNAINPRLNRVVAEGALLTELPVEERKSFLEAVAKGEDPSDLRFADLKKTSKDNAERNWFSSMYTHKSAYVHGNELAVKEAIMSGGKDKSYTLNWNSQVISRSRTLGELLHMTLDLMNEFVKITGMPFNVVELVRRYQELFGDPKRDSM